MKMAHKITVLLSGGLLLMATMQVEAWWPFSQKDVRAERKNALLKNQCWRNVNESFVAEGGTVEVLSAEEVRVTLEQKFHAFVQSGAGQKVPANRRMELWDRVYVAVSKHLENKHEEVINRYRQCAVYPPELHNLYVAVWKSETPSLEALIDYALPQVLEEFHAGTGAVHQHIPGGHAWPHGHGSKDPNTPAVCR